MLPAFNGSPALRVCPFIPADSARARLRDLDMGSDDWSDAGLPELLAYVYGAKGLKIPRKWQVCFPADCFN